MPRTPRRFLEAHRLISGHAKPSRKSYSKVEYKHLMDVRDIFADPNVVGIGIAEKTTKGKRAGELTLCFYVKEKKPRRRMSSHKMIPPVVCVDGKKPIFTDVYELGRTFKALANFQQSPIQSGFSVGNDESSNAGTVGAIVSFGGTRYILSNAHVLASRAIGDPGITQTTYPAREDIGQTNSVGVLRNIVTLTPDQNIADAALAQIIANVAVNPAIASATAPYSVAEPQDQMTIVGSGRTTSNIRGVVRDLHFSGPVEIPGTGKFRFVNQVVCVGQVAGGDSGSIMIDKDTRQIVGLMFAGTDNEFMFSRISAVRSALNMNFTFVSP